MKTKINAFFKEEINYPTEEEFNKYISSNDLYETAKCTCIKRELNMEEVKKLAEITSPFK